MNHTLQSSPDIILHSVRDVRRLTKLAGNLVAEAGRILKWHGVIRWGLLPAGNNQKHEEQNGSKQP